MEKQKILFVDLSSGKIEKKSIPLELRRKFLGGRGIDAYIMYKYIKPGIDPLGPENYISFGAGIVTGSGLPTSSRLHIGAKSPLTGLFGSANCGGEFASEMRYAGYDHIVVTGKAEKPVYLYIYDDDVEIRDASMLWGKDTSETETIIRDLNQNPNFKVVDIGVAGENMVRYACVISPPKNAAGRTGMGAVMGSKNLKAVAVRGTKGLKIADPQNLPKYRSEWVDFLFESKSVKVQRKLGTLFVYNTSNWAGQIRVRNAQLNSMKDGKDLEPENFIENYSAGPVGCVSCPVHCRHRYVVPYGEHKGKMAEGPEYTYLGAYGTEVDNPRLDVVLAAGYVGNLLGIDCLEYGSMLSWAMELYEKGLITKEDTGGIALEWGDPDIIIGMQEKIARREGFGDILAEGPKRAIEKLGKETEYYNININGMSGLHSDERPVPSFALGIATSTRGADHLRSRPALDLLNLPGKVLKDLYGFDVAERYQDYETKGKMVGFQERCFAVTDAVGTCKAVTILFSPHLLAFKEYAKMVKQVADIDFTMDEMQDVGERIYTVERLFNNREGAGRKDDYPPERYFTEPTVLGTKYNRGKTLDREKYEMALDEYYEAHGWDKEGRPKKETLEKIGLGELEEEYYL
jgi:aldehyde:ferredoxin oxidoreductase